MPTILLEFGWQAVDAQWHTVPCYLVAAVGMLLTAYLSDRTRHRYGFLMSGVVIATVGYAMLIHQETLSRNGKYAAIFLVTLGGFISMPISLGWLANNLSGNWKRAIAVGAAVTIGNCNGLISSNIFITSESPGYRSGYSTAMSLMLFGGLCATILEVLMWQENKDRAAGKQDYKLNLPKEDVENMGDYHPSFRFTL